MAISDKITSIQDHLKDDWDSVESLIGDTELDKNIENISSALDDLYNDLPKVTGSGTSITLDDTRKGRLESTLSGNTSQTQYTGKNLLPPTIATETKNGITLTNNGDGSYTLTGTYSTSTTFDMALPATLNGTYSFSGNNPTAGKNIQFRIVASSGSSLSTYLNNVNKTVENKTIENGTKQSIRIVGSFTSGFTFKPQLESGSTATSYEPYLGGVGTPNPTNPADVNVVSGDNEVHIDTKNKISFKNLTNSTLKGIDVTYNNSEVKLNGTTTSSGNIIPVGTNLQLSIPAGTYTFSLRVKSGSNSGIGGGNDTAIYLTKSSGSSTSAWLASMTISQINNGSGVKSVTFTTETPVNLYIYTYANNSGITFENYTLEAQIEEGNSMTSYVPYDGDTYNIDLPVENLLPYPWSFTSGSTLYGITITDNGDGKSFKISGTATQTVTFVLLRDTNKQILLDDMPYYLQGGINNNVRLYFNGGNMDTGSGATYTYPSSSTSTRLIGVYIVSGTTVNETIYPMLIKGSKPQKYTPYGTTPIELCKIGNYQDYFGKSDGSQLFDKENTLWNRDNNSGYNIGTAGTNTTRIRTSGFRIQGGKTYTISGIPSGISLTSVRTYTVPSGESIGSATRDGNTFTLNDNVNYIHLLFNGENFTSATNTLMANANIMLNEGSSALPWQPYGVGKWYLHKEIGKNVYNGSESGWGYGSADGFYITKTDMVSDVQVLSPMFTYYATRNLLREHDYGISNLYNLQRIYIRNVDYTNTNDFKDWLTTHNVEVYYPLSISTGIEITYQPLIDQLNLLEKAMSKDGQTNISQINNDLGFIISASALKKGDTIENNSTSLLMSFGGLPNTNGEEETSDFEEDVSDVEEETPIEESIEEETPIEESIEEETDEEPIEEETEIEEEEEQ